MKQFFTLSFILFFAHHTFALEFSEAQSLIPTQLKSYQKYTLDGLDYSLDEDALTAEITGYTEITDGQILIPATIEYEEQNYKVTSIGNSAFKNCEALTAVTFSEPSEIVSIEQYAFSKSSLTEIVLPSSVESIAKYAFYVCSELESVTFNTSKITDITLLCFQDCVKLKQIVLPNSVETIAGSAFKGCTSLEMAVIPASVTSISDSAFENCTSLENVYCEAGADVLNGNYDVFKNISETATLYVDDAKTFASDTYKWSTYFANIVDYSFPDLYINGIYYNIVYDLKSTTVQLEVTTGPIAYTGDMVIPEDFEYEGTYYSVVALADDAFDNCVDLNSVTLDTPIENMEALLMVPEGCTIVIPSNQQTYEKCLEVFLSNDADSDNVVFKGEYVKSENTIEAIGTVTTERVAVAIYNLAGQRLSSPTKGINIILYFDGTTQKVLVK